LVFLVKWIEVKRKLQMKFINLGRVTSNSRLMNFNRLATDFFSPFCPFLSYILDLDFSFAGSECNKSGDKATNN